MSEAAKETMRQRLERVPMPRRCRGLPRDRRGIPVPYFAMWYESGPDIRIHDKARIKTALKRGLCIVCGHRLGRNKAFVIGPMCTINRISAEPPCHRECGEWAARVCPFLAQPEGVRRKAGLPDDLEAPGGLMEERNPGTCAVWVCPVFGFDPHGLITLDAPSVVTWWHRGEPATRGQALRALTAGYAKLFEIAFDDVHGSIAELDQAYASAQRIVIENTPAPEPEAGFPRLDEVRP